MRRAGAVGGEAVEDVGHGQLGGERLLGVDPAVAADEPLPGADVGDDLLRGGGVPADGGRRLVRGRELVVHVGLHVREVEGQVALQRAPDQELGEVVEALVEVVDLAQDGLLGVGRASSPGVRSQCRVVGSKTFFSRR
jgi:hypothetical protein